MEYHTNSDMESDTQEPIASTSGTQKPKKWAYTHKYQTAWEANTKFCKWISVSKKGDTHFHCRTCACDCKGGISAVQKHNSSKNTSNYPVMPKSIVFLICLR